MSLLTLLLLALVATSKTEDIPNLRALDTAIDRRVCCRWYKGDVVFIEPLAIVWVLKKFMVAPPSIDCLLDWDKDASSVDE
ncbi:hypothetical protein [Psychrobacter sp. JB385]|uniref:hypothetical protein n=1 Tax=Psychrobacter sp. JB385 TaxID=1434841 RepID=UPI00097E83D5|nr:hypothetical protein [Psychrobacter sp. JB385]SJN43846.1 hypothetical protein CZ794_13220 [Psychrobacter sp. JB385]